MIRRQPRSLGGDTERRQRSALAAVLACALLTPLGLGTGSAGAGHYDRLLAPRSACPNQTDRSLPIARQERIMRCMHRYARQKEGRGGIRKLRMLQHSSAKKAQDILDCEDFDHEACGRDSFYWFRKVGFSRADCYGMAENIALGSRDGGSAREMMSAWLHSGDHRRTLLSSRYRRFGIGMVRGRYKGHLVQVWVAHFGYRC